MKPKETSQESLVPLSYFVVGLIAFTAYLVRFVPERVPVHMDLWGNVNRWGLKTDFVAMVVLYAFVVCLMIWAAVIGKHRGMGRVVYIIVAAGILFIYFHWLVVLLGLISLTSGTTNLYAFRCDFSQVLLGSLVLMYTLSGVYIQRFMPKVFDTFSRLLLLIAGGLSYLILATPAIPPLARVLLGGIVSLFIVVWLAQRTRRITA